jgi:hypothetical protein
MVETELHRSTSLVSPSDSNIFPVTTDGREKRSQGKDAVGSGGHATVHELVTH